MIEEIHPSLQKGQPTQIFERLSQWQCTFSIERDELAKCYYLSCNGKVVAVFLDRAYERGAEQSLEACQVEFLYITRSVQSTILNGYIAPDTHEEEAKMYGFPQFP